MDARRARKTRRARLPSGGESEPFMKSHPPLSLWVSALLFLGTLPIQGCSSSTPDDLAEVHDFPLRPAVKGEAEKLKACLESVIKGQRTHHRETGRYVSGAKNLNVDRECTGLHLKVRAHDGGYLATAKLVKDETMVVWIADETGKIFEEMPGDEDELEL